MKILLDTNIIIDNLARRDEYGDSLSILNLCESSVLKLLQNIYSGLHNREHEIQG